MPKKVHEYTIDRTQKQLRGADKTTESFQDSEQKMQDTIQRTVPDFSELKVGVRLGEASSGATVVVVIDDTEDGISGTLVRSPKKLGKETAQHCVRNCFSLMCETIKIERIQRVRS
jgi:hypothetical protein